MEWVVLAPFVILMWVLAAVIVALIIKVIRDIF